MRHECVGRTLWLWLGDARILKTFSLMIRIKSHSLVIGIYLHQTYSILSANSIPLSTNKGMKGHVDSKLKETNFHSICDHSFFNSEEGLDEYRTWCNVPKDALRIGNIIKIKYKVGHNLTITKLDGTKQANKVFQINSTNKKQQTTFDEKWVWASMIIRLVIYYWENKEIEDGK
jgi:hypothetical protein